MNKLFLYKYFQSQHFLKLGVYFIGSLLSLLVFLPIGPIRYSFLAFLLFILLLIIEFISYYKIDHEFKHDKTKESVMYIGKLQLFYIKKEEAGIEFIGKMDGKIIALRWYSIQKGQQKTIERLAKYKRVIIVYYPHAKAIKEFHTLAN